MSLAARLRALREARQVTQDELAAALRVSPGAVYAWERGMVLPSLVNAVAMAEWFGVTLDDLVGRQTERPPD